MEKKELAWKYRKARGEKLYMHVLDLHKYDTTASTWIDSSRATFDDNGVLALQVNSWNSLEDTIDVKATRKTVKRQLDELFDNRRRCRPLCIVDTQGKRMQVKYYSRLKALPSIAMMKQAVGICHDMQYVEDVCKEDGLDWLFGL